tara:strand:- start:218 stop:370 length:153 start_codon:yes stop_codon:yes gene_type:complete
MRLTEEEKDTLAVSNPEMLNVYNIELADFETTTNYDSECVLLKIEHKVRN